MWKDESGQFRSFYNGSTKTMIYAMINTFSNVYISRNDSRGLSKDHRVPLIWAGKDVTIIDKQSVQLRDRKVKSVSPVLDLAMTTPPLPYDESGRNTDPLATQCRTDCNGNLVIIRSGIPMRYSWELTLGSEKEDELWEIYENIISALKRPLRFTYILETDFQIERPVPINILDTSFKTVSWEFEEGDNSHPWEVTINFETVGYYYPPSQKQVPIKDIIINYKDPCADDPVNEILVQDEWKVDPLLANVDDPHDLVLTRTEDGDTAEICRLERNK